MKHIENSLQIQIMDWWRIKKPPFFLFAIEGGGKRNKMEAIRLKRAGVTAGVSDLCAMMTDGKVKWVELKRPATYKIGKSGKSIIATPKGTLSDKQKEFKAICDKYEHNYYVVYSLEDFISISKDWG